MSMSHHDDAITTREFWDARAATAALSSGEPLVFEDVFHRFLHASAKPGRRALEIGAYPGRFIYHLAANYGYEPFALDYCSAAMQLPAMFEAAGAPRLTLFHEDFLKWRTPERFDLVCSFGFIEHFNDWPGMIRRHAELVAEGGYLILATPHFRNLQYLLHWLFDTPNLRQHNVQAMDDRSWRRILASCGFEILHYGPYGTCQFWLHVDEVGPLRRLAGRAISRLSEELDHRMKRPNRLMSPYLVCVARRPERAVLA
jgi:SAM-dependent methyltransferase